MPKISELPAASAAAPTDQVEVNQAGTSKRVTVDQLLDVAGGAYLPLAGGTLSGDLKLGDPETAYGVWLFADGWGTFAGGTGWAGIDYIQRDAPANQRIWNTGAGTGGEYKIVALSDGYSSQFQWNFHRNGSTTLPGPLTIPHGTAPTTPVDGQIWTTSAGMFVRINGVTKTVTLT